MHHVRIGLAAIALLFVAAGPAQAGGINAEPGAYAETVYGEYAAGTGHQVGFELKTLATGKLEEIADMRFGDLIAPSGHWLESSQVGTDLRDPHFVTTAVSTPDMEYTAAGFKDLGYALELGTYRTLQVRAVIGSEAKEHQAVEFCWASLGHCALLDPTVLFADSMVQNRLRLAGEGWGLQVVNVEQNEPGMTAVCGMASNPSVKDRYYYWGGYWIEYKDVFGIVLVRKTLGAQKSGLRCDTTCKPAPYGYSNTSSCQSFLGWGCACDWEFGYGTTGGTGKWIAETKCTHRFLLNASASASVSNMGSASVSINWAMEGSPDSNGGQLVDTCGYY